jgi:hypothetical protein
MHPPVAKQQPFIYSAERIEKKNGLISCSSITFGCTLSLQSSTFLGRWRWRRVNRWPGANNQQIFHSLKLKFSFDFTCPLIFFSIIFLSYFFISVFFLSYFFISIFFYLILFFYILFSFMNCWMSRKLIPFSRRVSWHQRFEDNPLCNGLRGDAFLK